MSFQVKKTHTKYPAQQMKQNKTTIPRHSTVSFNTYGLK